MRQGVERLEREGGAWTASVITTAAALLVPVFHCIFYEKDPEYSVLTNPV